MTKYKVYASIDENGYFWLIIENNKIINRNASREDICKISKASRYYSKTNICHRCKEDERITDKNMITDISVLYPGNACREKYKDGSDTGEWVCCKHYLRDYDRYNPNSITNIRKLIADRRTGNLTDDNNIKGDRGQKLLCMWRGLSDLNIKNDNYCYRRDCLDEETELYYQAKVAYYNPINGLWGQGFKHERNAIRDGFIFKNVLIFCVSEDGKTVERVYEIPEEEIVDRKGIVIYKNCSKGDQWYEQYRIHDEEELKKLNKIWKNILEDKI